MEKLNWEVLVTPGIPIVTTDRPPGVRETYFQAMASTLIHGIRDAVLVDAFLTIKQANALGDWVASKGKNLTTIYITHGHGDHWFGVGTLLERFPNASDSSLSAMPPTTMSTSTSPSRMRRSDGNGSLRSTKSSRSTHAQLSQHIRDPKTTTVPGLSNR